MAEYHKLYFKEDDENITNEAVHTGKNTVRTINSLNKNMQKRKIKRGYAKAIREAKKSGESMKNTVIQTKRVTQKVAAVVKRHPVVLGIVVGLFLIIIFFTSTFSACSNVLINAISATVTSTYLASDADIDDAELAYTEWETDLQIQINNIENDRPNYDEYRYNLGTIGHSPYELMAYLTAKYQDFQFSLIEPQVREIFDEQYKLELVDETEVRYTVDGVPYDWHILNVTLTVTPLSEVVSGLMDDHQKENYDTLLITKGSRQYVGNPLDFDWLPVVSSGYGWRISPITGEKELHRGVDIPASAGTEVHAAQSGVVTTAEYDESYGNYVVITGADGISTTYAHCETLLVSVGQTVESGDIIATVGSTGDSTGAHLHYEISKGGRNINPYFFAVTNGAT